MTPAHGRRPGRDREDGEWPWPASGPFGGDDDDLGWSDRPGPAPGPRGPRTVSGGGIRPATSSGVTPARRGFVVLLMAAALVGAGVADRSGRESSASPSSRSSLLPSVLEAAAVMPSAASARALASAWSCPLATAAGAAGAAEGQVVVANVGDGPLSGVVTVTPADGEAANKTITVDPHSSLQVKESDVVHLGADRPWASALVDLHGGQAGVELLASGQWGTSITPCSPSASDHWYFATGSTAVDATMMMGLFNPFPSDAVVDLAFVTDQGPANPSEFQGVVVPARGLRVLDIGDHVRRRDALAATVTARTGRVVAERLQARTGGNAGLTAALGAPSPGETWYFPDGYSADHDIEHYVIYNPEPAEAHVSLKVNLDTGSAEPFDLTVPPAATFTVMVESESRIPPQVGHSAELHSLNGVPVVVERTVQASAPAPRVGGGAMVGARVAAPRWLLPVGNATAGVDEWVVVYNPGAMAATVSLRALEDGQEMAIPQMQGVAIPPGRRHAFRLGDQLQLSPLPVVVGATAPVVVERDLYVNGQPVLILNAGEPLP